MVLQRKMSHPLRGVPNGSVCITPASRKLSLVAIRSMKKHPSALLGLLWDSGRRHHSFTRRGRLDNAQRQLAEQLSLCGRSYQREKHACGSGTHRRYVYRRAYQRLPAIGGRYHCQHGHRSEQSDNHWCHSSQLRSTELSGPCPNYLQSGRPAHIILQTPYTETVELLSIVVGYEYLVPGTGYPYLFMIFAS